MTTRSGSGSFAEIRRQRACATVVDPVRLRQLVGSEHSGLGPGSHDDDGLPDRDVSPAFNRVGGPPSSNRFRERCTTVTPLPLMMGGGEHGVVGKYEILIVWNQLASPTELGARVHVKCLLVLRRSRDAVRDPRHRCPSQSHESPVPGGHRSCSGNR